LLVRDEDFRSAVPKIRMAVSRGSVLALPRTAFLKLARNARERQHQIAAFTRSVFRVVLFNLVVSGEEETTNPRPNMNGMK